MRKNTAYYAGDQQKLTTRLDDNFDLKYGILANEGGFEALVRSLQIASAAEDKTSLNHAIKQVSKAITELPNIRAGIGTDLNNIGGMANQQKDFKVFAGNAVTSIKTVDAIRATALLAQEKTALDAAYATIGRLSNLSLTQYLR